MESRGSCELRTSYRTDRMPNKKETVWMTRKCLNCGGKFRAMGKFNRLCGRCKGERIR